MRSTAAESSEEAVQGVWRLCVPGSTLPGPETPGEGVPGAVLAGRPRRTGVRRGPGGAMVPEWPAVELIRVQRLSIHKVHAGQGPWTRPRPRTTTSSCPRRPGFGCCRRASALDRARWCCGCLRSARARQPAGCVATGPPRKARPRISQGGRQGLSGSPVKRPSRAGGSRGAAKARGARFGSLPGPLTLARPNILTLGPPQTALPTLQALATASRGSGLGTAGHPGPGSLLGDAWPEFERLWQSDAHTVRPRAGCPSWVNTLEGWC